MAHSNASAPTVMVVEDFDDTRQMIALGLRKDGYQVVEATNGQEALEIARRKCPDLVVMDLSLPMLDGLSAVYRMRELDALCDVPVIACTAHGADVHMKAARAVGCDEYMTKPIDLKHLSETVGRLLVERREGKGNAGRKREVKKPLEPDELLDYIDALMGK